MNLETVDYVKEAEKVIDGLIRKDSRGNIPITTSKIRNLLQLIMDLYNDILDTGESKLNANQIEQINYLKIRFVYEAGRDLGVKKFVENAHIIEIIDKIGGKKDAYIRFTRYMEALVAYHKFKGGKDK